MIELQSLIQLDCIRHPLEATDARGAIEELVHLLHERGHIADVRETAEAVWVREQQRSTGIGEGLAVPHGRCATLKKVVAAVGWAPVAIDFKAADGKPVNLVVLIVSPTDDTSGHVQALGAITRVLGNSAVRRAAARSRSAEELYETFCEDC